MITPARLEEERMLRLLDIRFRFGSKRRAPRLEDLSVSWREYWAGAWGYRVEFEREGKRYSGRCVTGVGRRVALREVRELADGER